MKELVIICPIRDNAGRSLAYRLASIERELLDAAGGYTVQTVRGAWREGGRVYRDTSRQYTVAVDADALRSLEAAVPRWCRELRQLALYVAVRDGSVRIVAA